MMEPNCDMPWEVYLDWLQDQGNEDLRFIETASILTGCCVGGYSLFPDQQAFGSGMKQTMRGNYDSGGYCEEYYLDEIFSSASDYSFASSGMCGDGRSLSGSEDSISGFYNLFGIITGSGG